MVDLWSQELGNTVGDSSTPKNEIAIYFFLFSDFAVGAQRADFDIVIMNGRVMDEQIILDAWGEVSIIGSKIAALTKTGNLDFQTRHLDDAQRQ